MAEIIASAVVSETLSRISTFLIDRYYDRKSSGRDNTERLEMEHITVTDVSLLRWRKKLKRATDECDAVLHKRKRAAMEDTEAKAPHGSPTPQNPSSPPLATRPTRRLTPWRSSSRGTRGSLTVPASS
jgi:hypothetical protein